MDGRLKAIRSVLKQAIQQPYTGRTGRGQNVFAGFQPLRAVHGCINKKLPGYLSDPMDSLSEPSAEGVPGAGLCATWKGSRGLSRIRLSMYSASH